VVRVFNPSPPRPTVGDDGAFSVFGKTSFRGDAHRF
jgi:hypothetical protein